MITGIVSLVLACGYGVGLLASPVAWYLGKSSMNRIDASQGQLGGRGMAQAGMILGIIGTVLLVLAIVAAVVVFGLLAGSYTLALTRHDAQRVGAGSAQPTRTGSLTSQTPNAACTPACTSPASVQQVRGAGARRGW